MNDKLFVYGTLLDFHNDYGIYLRYNSRFYTNGRIKGSLYHLGEYPGAVLGGENCIYGSILRMDNPAEALSMIDVYEGYGEDQPQPNEFIRVLTMAETDAGPVTCWIYLYNLPVDAFKLIAGGKYHKQ
jgi:gamma-glutamylcyclotransferase (GGCT)/AIG2-like uncharacterized protein YtfP